MRKIIVLLYLAICSLTIAPAFAADPDSPPSNPAATAALQDESVNNSGAPTGALDPGEEVPATTPALPPAAGSESPMTTPASLWQRIRSGFTMPELDSPLVARHEAWFLNHPEYFQRMIERSRLYLYFIVEEVEQRGMPMEIALLPMIESGFNPGAYSRAHAVGIWQFIPSTGRRYGLQQTWWYDGRRDVMAATGAALDYLQRLYAEFGDWQLALASYNWGENAVARAIARNKQKGKPTDYLSLHMPRETRNYLPKLQAVRNIVAYPSLLSFPLEEIPNRPYFTAVNTPDPIDMKVAAQLAEMTEEDFRSLNPGHSRPVITPNGSRTLLLPVDKVGVFNANLQVYDQPLVSWQTYTLKKNESFDGVALRFGLSPERLKEINGISRHLSVREGRTLLVPMGDDDPESNIGQTWNNPEFLAPEKYFGGRLFYRVRAGDSLYSIARKNGVTVAAIKEWNRLRGNQLRIGQRLTIHTNPRLSRQ